MALAEYDRALPRILVYEGGKVDDKHDPGGRTAYGITQVTFNLYNHREGRPQRDVWTITKGEVAAIYRQMYWDRIKGDILPVGVAFTVFDAAVNSGIAQAVKWLQRALGDNYNGAVDGDMGPTTLKAIALDEDNDLLVQRICARRLGSLKTLKTWKRYGKGWSARIANVMKIGQAWATGTVGPAPVDVSALGGHEKAKVVEAARVPLVSAPIAHSASGAGAAGTTLTQLTDLAGSYKDLHAYVLYGFIGLTAAGIGLGAWANFRTYRAKQARDGARAVEVDADADNLMQAVMLEGDSNLAPPPNPKTPDPAPPAPIPTASGTGAGVVDQAAKTREGDAQVTG